MTGADWKALGDGLADFWTRLGWQSVTGVGVFALLWRLIDAWGKRPK